ncbi:hypothetical protein B296_00057369 [Ensete ventricosum]|uniref:Gelsolin-like domain-containing protein n=1 Tax=Ensete ventricosum TaxID=4639 RepID=A0A426XRL6_ENSVE|nr:hypothetical protein B296_00057369 [Ensete ventricosum]
MAPQSSYDPLYLVPKSVDLSSTDVAGFLDSRGAFVVHVPSAIYVWVGHSCGPSMATAAATAALQVVRYERAEGPIITVNEGFEPAAFWAALTDEPLSAVPEEIVGNRRVELYDLDYDIFRRATARARAAPPLPKMWTGPETITPVKDSGWCRLRRKFASRDWKDIIKAVVERRSLREEDLRASNAVPSPGSFSVESSTTPSSSSADSASVLSTFSPNSSSSSDWNNLSPPRSELHRASQTELNPELQPSCFGNVKGKDLRSLAERRGGTAPPLFLMPSAGDTEGRLSSTDIVRDWCLNDIGRGNEEDAHIYLDRAGTDFFDRMGTPMDTPVQVCKQAFLHHGLQVELCKDACEPWLVQAGWACGPAFELLKEGCLLGVGGLAYGMRSSKDARSATFTSQQLARPNPT